MKNQEKVRQFEASISPYLGAAYNLAVWMTRSPADAEDIVQDAFLRAFAAFDSFRGAEPKAWLLAIVRNTTLTWLKRSKGSQMAFDELPDHQNPREPSPGPEAQLLASCDRDRVRNALHELPEEFREALILRELEGLSYREISTLSGVPLGTVMSRLSRGREWLKRVLTRPTEAPAR